VRDIDLNQCVEYILLSWIAGRATQGIILFGATTDLLDSFLRGGPALQDEAVGNVVLVDVADVGHRFLADLLGRHILHVVKPDVGVEPALGGFLPPNVIDAGLQAAWSPAKQTI
jgi:hypothetical protein